MLSTNLVPLIYDDGAQQRRRKNVPLCPESMAGFAKGGKRIELALCRDLYCDRTVLQSQHRKRIAFGRRGGGTAYRPGQAAVGSIAWHRSERV